MTGSIVCACPNDIQIFFVYYLLQCHVYSLKKKVPLLCSCHILPAHVVNYKDDRKSLIKLSIGRKPIKLIKNICEKSIGKNYTQ